MDYLVVAPHTPFFQWQVALLVKSFRIRGEEENLAVLLVATGDAVQSGFCNHFADHPRLRAIRLPCDTNPDIVRLHGLNVAVKSKLVNPTFTLLPPYCVYRHPVEEPKAKITFSCKPDFTLQHIEGFGISRNAVSKRFGGKPRWLPVGDVFIFDNVQGNFFDTAVNRGELIAFDSQRETLRNGSDQQPKSIFRAAMAMTILEKSVSIDTSRNLESAMNEQNKSSNVINYYYGLPPNFSRSYYPINGELVTFSDHPYNGILRCENTHGAAYMKYLARELLTSSVA